ncbi:hypothetical protein [Estrella lausannensis]|uniref:Conserved putative membrane protein n=1 Tax=Estrella lausannensis TaxID=483423 RepID=A0A0H5DPX7_9BACT|nr:hypothetical protein [Estrella lausannensis]CRX38068.1 Conserved putative membrane protein [Estrella lausannensis]
MQTIFSSILTFINGLFFLLCGLITLITAWSPRVRDSLFEFAAKYDLLLSIFGLLLILIGALILAYSLLFAKRRYYYIRSGPQEILVSEDIAREYVTKYFHKLFGVEDLPCDLKISRNKIHITANLPYIPEDEQYELTQKIDAELRDLLSYKLGYKTQYFLSISFEGVPKRQTAQDTKASS